MKIGFIGAGMMAESMLSAFIEAGICTRNDITASDIDARRRTYMKKKYGISLTSDNTEVASAARIVFLAVKPQNMDSVLPALAARLGKTHLVISIAAGVKISTLRKALPKARLVRVMPNMACSVAEAMSGYSMGRSATERDRKTVAKLIGSFGTATKVNESKLDAVTALSGSGPAFLAYCLDAMASGAVKEGLSRKDALAMAAQTMMGTGKLLRDTQIDPAELVSRIASAKGTTAAGLKILGNSTAGSTLVKTVRAAARRSRELSK